jgi:hypothetical protein
LLRNPGLKPEDIFILSLGTGRVKLQPGGEKLTNAGILGWFTQVNLIDVILNADSLFDKFEVKSISSVERYRIQFDLDPQNKALDNASLANLQSLSQVADNFIQTSQDKIAQLCQFLTQRPSRVSKSVEKEELAEATV